MKNARHEQILQLIEIYDIETQEELAEKLNEKGFTVTQATVSRDIRQLQLRKITESDGKSHYALGGGYHVDLSRKYKRVLKDAFVSADHAGNIIVIHTVSGMAMAVAEAIDVIGFNEIVGCIAGDNTIMCAVRSVDDTILLMDKLRKIISE